MEQDELRRLEEQCIQDDPPPCNTNCPAHVDVRGMCREIGRGDFGAALKIVTKTLPFPGIMGCICEQPCRQSCNRKDAGDAIAVAMLERACAELGGEHKIRPLPPKNKRVAVAGAGLSALTVAYDLAKKGFTIVVYNAASRPGGGIWDYPADVLLPSIVENDLRILDQLDIEIKNNMGVGYEVQLAELCKNFDAVYLGVGAAFDGAFGLNVDECGQVIVDGLTFMTGQEGVFAGGSMLHRAEATSPVRSVSEGHRAATSIDRFLQKVSLVAARKNEGAYESRLYTSLSGVEHEHQVPVSHPQQGYSRDEAMAEAQRCLLCECLECVKVCEYLDHYKSYPKKYMREIYNNLSIVMGTRFSNKLINSCSMCDLCAEVCPTDVNMADICLQARQTMVKQKRMPPSAHDFALRDMAFSNSEKFAMSRHAPGTASSEYLFFPGCQLSASSPAHVERVYAYLRDQLDGGVGLSLGCCGAPAHWAGREDLLAEASQRFLEDYERMGSPHLILACSSCYQMFQQNLPQVKLLSLWQVMQQHGLPQQAKVRLPEKVAVHDPCTTRYLNDMQESVRDLLHTLGCHIEELDLSREKTECCSYGGLMWFANRPLAEQVIQRRVEESQLDYVTYCAVCRDFYASHGKRTLHLLDLLWENPDEAAERHGPGYSQRHENRARLKNKLLKELWGEEMVEQKAYESIRLVISPDVQKRMEDRLILFEDLQQVVYQAETMNSKILDKNSGHFIAYSKPTCVTYWVEYAPAGDGFEIFNAYSHRMEILSGVQNNG